MNLAVEEYVMSGPLNYVIEIPAPRGTVWSCMLDDATYRDWTTAFSEGSYYVGEWRTGADMHFLGPGGGGMRARIERADAPEYVSIAHLGEFRDGAPVDGPEWVDAFERYRFLELADGGTRLEIELLNVPAEYAPMMNQMWPKALERLRQICVSAMI
jgi:uncharacterized protein YndB with AHSA1/START domain